MLVSFGVSCYNAERYILECLEGIVRQTYRPLEVVISDDCSTDKSWECVREYVDSYKKNNPNDQIDFVLNHNLKNVGNFGNWEKVVSLCHGVLIFKNDGDDVSHPERAARIVNAWQLQGASAPLILCHARLVNSDRSRVIGHLRPVDMFVHGCVSTYKRECFEGFPRYGRFDAYDDQIFSNRAMFFGDPLVVPELLVDYRTGLTKPKALNYRKPVVAVQRTERNAYKLLLKEIKELDLGLPSQRVSTLRDDFSQHLKMLRYSKLLYDGETFRTRLIGYKLLSRSKKSCLSPICRIILLPHWLSDFLLSFWVLVKRMRGVVNSVPCTER